ncbi:MAG TPA: phytanoyl-CoA dioxygenase family protein, partial [Polyangiales bacterium]|nr:phytanoyl-CoA dioxygenase family protein [Polyangiales bacterium]
ETMPGIRPIVSGRRPRALLGPLFRRFAYTRLAEHVLLRPGVRWGMRRFRRTQQTPPWSYSLFRMLYCVTNGGWNTEAVRALGATPLALPCGHGLIRDRAHHDEVLATLRRDGYCVVPNAFSPAACAALTALASNTPARLVPAPAEPPARDYFERTHPRAPRYELDEVDLIASPDVQRLMADHSLLALAQDYLGAAPINDLVTMWWTARAGATPSSEAAQLFHFDMDRVSFLKVFFYLTDVTPQTGPHVYVRGSHRNKPKQLLRDRRFSDAEIHAAYGSDVHEITGPRGTVIIADTSGMHKGKVVETSERLLLQLEYTSSLFGQRYETTPWPSTCVPELHASRRDYPSVYARYGGR